MVGFLHQVVAVILYVKPGFGANFSLQTIDVFILITYASLLLPCQARSMNIFGLSKPQTDVQ